MRLRWTDDAVTDLRAIRDYIETDNVEAAQRVAMKVIAQAESLLLQPNKGRPGRVKDTRETIVPNLPYFIAYRVKKESLEILRVMHTSQRYP